MKTITNIDVSSIKPNPLNPRKHFDTKAIDELTESIKSVGVLQPITVRPIDSGYELVCGERRWRASQQANQNTIPAIIRELSDEQAIDISITENLQRKDIDPFEEADAFKYLIDKGQTYDDISARFGKSTIFVRGRLKLIDIIDPLRDLYNSGDINISHCLELCKFTEDIQQEIYEKHYKDEHNYYSWRSDSIKELKNNIERYLEDFDDVQFDTTQCKSCSNNSAVCGLFPELGSVCCTNRECFKLKTLTHKVDSIVKMYNDDPELLFWKGQSYSTDTQELISRLQDRDITYIDESNYSWSDSLPDDEHRASICRKGYHVAYGKDIFIYPQTSADGKLTPEDSTIKELRGKDQRNKEILEEKTTADVRSYVTVIPAKELCQGDITDHEKQCILYTLIKDLEHDQQKNLVIFDSYSISDDQAWNIAINGTPEEIAYIYRCTIINKIGNRYRYDNQTDIFFKWINQREPNRVAEIELKHKETYLRRKEKIDAKIAEIELNK